MSSTKMIGLAAVAALALMGVAGVGTAGATVLCKTMTSPCGADYPAETKLSAEVTEEGPGPVLKGSSGFSLECQTGTIESSTQNTGGSSEAVSLVNEWLSVLNCPWPYDVTFTKFGSFEIHHASGGDGTITAGGIEIINDNKSLFTKCKYKVEAGSHFGALFGGSEPTIEVDVVFQRVEGALCDAETRWTANLDVTSPTPLYVVES